jgi:hypothetical protein
MSEKTENPPAFPTPMKDEDWEVYQHYGMTLRDWFAGQALAGMMENERFLDAIRGSEGATPSKISHWAYKVADAMLAERVKEREQ